MGASRRIIPALRHAATRTLETRMCSTLLIVFAVETGDFAGFEVKVHGVRMTFIFERKSIMVKLNVSNIYSKFTQGKD